MCSGLQGDETSRYPPKCQLHRFWCRRHFLFQNDFARFIQYAVARPAITEVHPNRELVSFENHVSIYPNSANLLHCRSPFYCASSTSNIGSVSHPAGDRPSHLIWQMLISSVLKFLTRCRHYRPISSRSQGVARLRASIRILVRRLERRLRRMRVVSFRSERRNISSTC